MIFSKVIFFLSTPLLQYSMSLQHHKLKIPVKLKHLRHSFDNPPQMCILTKNYVVAVNASHINRVCSTWGNYHWKTFDGHMYRLVSSCNHELVSDCNDEGFNIQMRRSLIDGIPTISTIVFMIDGMVAELSRRAVTVDKNT